MATSSKLKNPTRYHLLATQQRQDGSNHLYDSIDPLMLMEDQNMDNQQPNSPLEDDDMESVRYMQNQNRLFMFDFVEDSDYSSSVDMFSHLMPFRHNSISSSHDTPLYRHSFEQQTLSAPSHMGYDFMNFQSTMNQSIAATGSRSLEEYESIQINHQLLSEKKRRRRESHNAVERRRRENINERIQELGTMLPEHMLEELITMNANGSSNKPNKGAILRKSVDHIRVLQQQVDTHKQRIYELEKLLAGLST